MRSNGIRSNGISSNGMSSNGPSMTTLKGSIYEGLAPTRAITLSGSYIADARAIRTATTTKHAKKSTLSSPSHSYHPPATAQQGSNLPSSSHSARRLSLPSPSHSATTFRQLPSIHSTNASNGGNIGGPTRGQSGKNVHQSQQVLFF